MRTRQGLQQRAGKMVRRGAELVRAGVHSLEIKPPHKTSVEAEAQPASAHVSPQQGQGASATKVRTGIVSVHGRDVEKMHCTGGKRTA